MFLQRVFASYAQAGAYTSQQLRDAFAAHGPVEDVILRGSKKKSKVNTATNCTFL